MTDEETKQTAEASSSSSSSSSQPLAQSLVQVFGALEQTLRDLTSSVQANTAVTQKAYALLLQVQGTLQKLHERGKLDDKQRTAVLSSLLALTKSVNDVVNQGHLTLDKAAALQKQLAEAEKNLGAADAEIKDRLKEVSGEHPAYDPEGLPTPLRGVWIWLGNVGWKNKAKVAAWIAAGGFAPTIWVKIKIAAVFIYRLFVP